MLKACTTYLRQGWNAKLKNKHTIDAKNYVTSESYVNAKIITNWKRKTDRLAEREKTITLRHVV